MVSEEAYQIVRENKQDECDNDRNQDCKNCPATWREVKKRIAEDETGFVTMLKEAWNKRK
jgi:hypothetical protein